MITLTTPHPLSVVLGSAETVGYDKLVMDSVQHNPVQRSIRSQFRLMATASPEMPIVQGRADIDLPTGKMLFEIEPLRIRRVMKLTSGQVAAAQSWIDAGQKNIEDGLISIGVISGTRANGI